MQYADGHQQIAVRVLSSGQIFYQADQVTIRLGRSNHHRRDCRLAQDLEGFEAPLATNQIEARTISGNRNRSFQPQAGDVLHEPRKDLLIATTRVQHANIRQRDLGNGRCLRNMKCRMISLRHGHYAALIRG
ncbi:hypothetical protein D9M70_465990 [compost metagenome]